MTRKLYIKTFGCQMNEYDSTRIADLMAASHNMVLTDAAEQADMLLLNTCSVRERLRRKFFPNWAGGENGRSSDLIW